MKIEFLVNPDDSVKQDILAGLRRYNLQFFPHENSDYIACVASNEQGEFCGGLFGEVYTNTLFVEYLWVDDSKRSAGLGSKLVKLAEEKVKAMGATHAYLDTFSFQAREFYLKQGFEEVGRFSGFPMEGVDKIFLQKKL